MILLASALLPLVKEVAEVEIGHRLLRRGTCLLGSQCIIVPISKEFRGWETGQSKWPRSVFVVRMHEIVLVLTRQIASVQHVLTKAIGCSRRVGGVSRLAHSNVLGEDGGTQLVNKELHVDQYLREVRTCGRESIHSLVDTQGLKPIF